MNKTNKKELSYQEQKVLRHLNFGGSVMVTNKVKHNAALRLQKMGLVILSEPRICSGIAFVRKVK